jgi:hypothetical protein
LPWRASAPAEKPLQFQLHAFCVESGRSVLVIGTEAMEEPTAIAAAPCLALELAQACANTLRPAFNSVV